MLWKRLSATGVKGKMLNALKSLYASVFSCVRMYGLTTEWFNVKTWLRQGCLLSPIIFKMFINDFALSVKALGKDVKIDNEEKVCIKM